MKSIISIAVLGFLLVAEAAKDHCSKPQDVMNSASVLESTPWKSMHSSCTEDVKRQIGMEYDAAIKYLSLGAYFAMDVVNRPGFAKFFFESASEERQHAIKLIEYLSMRGEEVTDVSKLVSINTTRMPGAFESTMTGKKALELALAEEVKVTESIVKLVKICEKEEKQFSAPSEANKMFNDYHLVDWLTAEFLDEQYKGQRDLAGKISTLMKMGTSNYLLGEFLFDKKLLSGQV